jgi:VCBS repeat protein
MSVRSPCARGAIAIGAAVAALALPGTAIAGVHARESAFAVGDGTTAPGRIAAGDFNGDGVVDLVTSTLTATNNVSVLRGTGAGTFAPARVFTAALRPESVAVADFDEDGLSDIVLPIDATPGGVQVFLSNGDGTFAPQPPIPLPAQSDDVVTGRFNGDTHADIAVAGPGAVTVITGVGDGTFNASFPQVATGGGVVREALAAGDLNGDGRDDVIASPGATVAGVPSVAAMLTGPNGALAAPTPIAVPGATGRPAAADFNGDGRADVVTPASGGAAVLLGAANGSLGAPLTLGAPTPGAVAVGDANHDTRADVMVASNAGTVTGFAGNGDGTFGPPVPVAGVSSNGFATALGADLDGDGFADLALGGLFAPGRVTVALNSPSAALGAAALTFASTVTGATSPVQAVSLTNDGQPPLRVSGVSLGGANPTDFRVIADGCTGAVVGAGASCEVTVAMAPAAVGSRAAQLVFASNSAGGVAQMALGGTGLAPPPAPVQPTATPDRTAPTVALTVRAQRLRTVLRQGLRAQVSSSEPGTADVRLLLSRTLARRYHLPSKTAFVVSRHTLRFTRSGKLPVRLQLSKRAARALRNAGQVTFTLRVAVRDAAGNTRTRTNTVALQR